MADYVWDSVTQQRLERQVSIESSTVVARRCAVPSGGGVGR